MPAGGMAWYVETPAEARVGDGLTLEGEGVVHYPTSTWGELPASVASTRVLRQGRPAPGGTGGCTFGGEVVLTTPVVVNVTELSYDAGRCLSLVEVGVTPGATVEEPDTVGSIGGAAAAPVSRKTASSGEISTLAVRSFRARTRSQVRELAYPVIPATSEVYANVNVYNGNPQYAPTTASYSWNMLRESGWYQTYFDWSAYFGYSYARATVYSKFRNDVAGRVLCGIL